MDGMKYEKTPVSKKVSATATKKAVNNDLSKIGTGYILWHLVKRHKLAISITLNIFFIVNWALPAWPAIVKSLI